MCLNDEFRVIFVYLSPPFLAIYYAFAFLFEEKFPQICIRNDKKMVPNRWLLQRILQQNALQYAAKRIVFCIKTHCILHQNALHFAPKRTAICTKTQSNMYQNAR